ncbi:hypothetical protein D3C78_1542060 [compost metagenome]
MQVARRVDQGRGEQQHGDQHAQRLAQPAPDPAGDAETDQQGKQGGPPIDAPGEEIILFSHRCVAAAGEGRL